MVFQNIRAGLRLPDSEFARLYVQAILVGFIFWRGITLLLRTSIEPSHAFVVAGVLTLMLMIGVMYGLTKRLFASILCAVAIQSTNLALMLGDAGVVPFGLAVPAVIIGAVIAGLYLRLHK